MVGEIRDLEAGRDLHPPSLTGRLVCSTLHTNDAPGCDHPTHRHGRRALPRRLRRRTGSSPSASSAAFAPTTARRRSRSTARRSSCRPSRRSAWTSPTLKDVPSLKEAMGCRKCRGTGYRRPRRRLRDLPPEAAPRPDHQPHLQPRGDREGDRPQDAPLAKAGWLKVAAGLTTIDEPGPQPGTRNE
jgi:type II secretory ATPase GspE/PulE/Tfp pilus assembly ATPase PilB-like protein